MSLYNGVNIETSSQNSTLESGVSENENSFDQEDISPKSFRGFVKKPVVVVPRYDVTPYLKKHCMTANTDRRHNHLDSLMKYVRNCSVRVARDDLRKLQSLLLIRSPRSDISESKIDEAMGHLRCKICEKIYSSEKKLQNHQQNKHMIVYRPKSKPQKKVSFSDHVIVHEIRASIESAPKVKTKFKVGEKIPDYMLPSVVVEKIIVGGKDLEDTIDFVDVNSFDVHNGMIKKAVVDPRSKKTIVSRHQCETCHKFYSSRYCLNRHIETQHGDYENLRCKVCEETFVWPSLLKTHKCIRSFIPEMPFEDARPEIHFDNLNELTQNSIDNFNIVDSDDYMNSVDFEIPAPIVSLNEGDEQFIPNDNTLQNIGYKVVMQEVPIEF
ncbi:uncharacterized protein LOC106139675 isoform X2 [Amyelois transitella]|uniref:uncharacterized protein LOC106139675 isoform X2 n=1 Tax=Amyelois transitella TaxID=680683 RepID=UPI00299044EC|nr:uncharacterized protein LOC106139675 isoform X2 [Amyelois transitella]